MREGGLAWVVDLHFGCLGREEVGYVHVDWGRGRDQAFPKMERTFIWRKTFIEGLWPSVASTAASTDLYQPTNQILAKKIWG